MPHRKLIHLSFLISIANQNPEFSQKIEDTRITHTPELEYQVTAQIQTDTTHLSSTIRNVAESLRFLTRLSLFFWSRETGEADPHQNGSLQHPCCWFFRK
jgi:hypothetical protein